MFRSALLGAASVVAFGLVSAFVWYSGSEASRPIVVAVLDSGFSGGPSSEQSFLAPGTAPASLTDSLGHGTKVALTIHETCSECLVLPVKVTESGTDADAARIAHGIEEALARSARVINISLGVSQGSPELAQAVQRAQSAGAVLVTAAGEGLANPFRPDPLSHLFPQHFAETIVVGAVRSGATGAFAIDPLTNFGPELDLSVPAESASFAAAKVSGWIGQWLSRGAPASLRATPQEIRHQLRVESKPLPGADFERMGFGILETGLKAPSFLERIGILPLMTKDLAIRAEQSSIEFSLPDEDITEVSWTRECKGQQAPLAAQAQEAAQAYKKGRARIESPEPFFPSDRECMIRVALTTAQGQRLEREIRPTAPLSP